MLLLGAGLMALSATLTWATASVGGGTVSYTLLEIPVAPAFYAVGVLAVGVGGIAAMAGRSAGLEIAALAAVVVALVTGVFVVFAESIATFLPGEGLFIAFRRATLGAGVGAGAWLSLITAVAVVVIALESVRERAGNAARLLYEDGRPSLLALSGLVLALGIVVQTRQETWVAANAAGIDLSTSGVGIPVVSPATFIAIWILVCGLALVCLGYLEVGALLAAAAGWALSAAAGATLAAAATVAGTHVAGIHAAYGAWLTFLLGAAIAVGAGTLLWRRGEAP